MENKTVGLCFLLLVSGLVVGLCSLVPYPIKKIEAYEIPYSQIFYDHHQFVIPANNSEYKTIEGVGLNGTMSEGSIVSIFLQIQPSEMNFQIEGRSAVIKYENPFPERLSTRAGFDPSYLFPKVEFTSDWRTIRTYNNICSLSTNYTVSDGVWLYRLRFENIGLTNKTIDLSIVGYWTEVDFRDTTMHHYLLPFGFAYCGIAILAIVSVVSVWGMNTKRFTGTDVRNFVQELSDDISYYMEMKKIVIVIMLTLTLLVLSLFVHARLGVGEVLVDEEMTKTFVRYYGFPLEMMGTVTPLTIEDWNLFVGPFVEVGVYSHGSTKYEYTFSYPEYFEGTLLVLQDGLLVNVAFYFALSFGLVLTLSYLAEKLRNSNALANVIGKLPDF